MAKQMEQFEKWLANNVHSNWTWEQDARESWKAALEWVLISEWNTPDELTTLIGKELLNNEQES